MNTNKINRFLNIYDDKKIATTLKKVVPKDGLTEGDDPNAYALNKRFPDNILFEQNVFLWNPEQFFDQLINNEKLVTKFMKSSYVDQILTNKINTELKLIRDSIKHVEKNIMAHVQKVKNESISIRNNLDQLEVSTETNIKNLYEKLEALEDESKKNKDNIIKLYGAIQQMSQLPIKED